MLKLIILTYILGVITAVYHFSNEIKKLGSEEHIIIIMIYVMSKKTHYKYTLMSWFYFIDK